DLLVRVEPLRVRVGGEAVLAEALEHPELRLELAAFAVARAVDPDRERAVGGDRRVLLAQAAGGGVARVRGELLVRAHQALVQLPEAAERQVDLPPHLDHGRGLALHPQWDRLDRAQVRRDVLALYAVAA